MFAEDTLDTFTNRLLNNAMAMDETEEAEEVEESDEEEDGEE